MKKRLGSTDIGTLPGQQRRKADRQLLRQRQLFEIEFRQGRFAREPSAEDRESVARRGEVALQGWQRRPRRIELCTQDEHAQAGDSAELILALNKIELFLLRRND